MFLLNCLCYENIFCEMFIFAFMCTFVFVLGVCLGICGMIAVLPGFISPAVVGLLTYQNVSMIHQKHETKEIAQKNKYNSDYYHPFYYSCFNTIPNNK